jgi:hypothetical protein
MRTDAMSDSRTASVAAEPNAPRPWWRFGIVWFMLAGPAVAVVASLASAVLAYRHADIVLTETPTATSLAARALSARH